MWDQTVEYHDLAMVCSDLNVPSRPLPDGFGYRGFQPGDEHHWAEIERSAGEFTNLTDALARFDQDFGADQAELGRRMLFLTTASGEAIGTATAWFDQGVGQLYWVGVDQRYQRRGFARPLVAHTMRRLWQLGHRQAKLSTQEHPTPQLGGGAGLSQPRLAAVRRRPTGLCRRLAGDRPTDPWRGGEVKLPLRPGLAARPLRGSDGAHEYTVIWG